MQHLFQPVPNPNEILHGKFLSLIHATLQEVEQHTLQLLALGCGAHVVSEVST